MGLKCVLSRAGIYITSYLKVAVSLVSFAAQLDRLKNIGSANSFGKGLPSLQQRRQRAYTDNCMAHSEIRTKPNPLKSDLKYEGIIFQVFCFKSQASVIF